MKYLINYIDFNSTIFRAQRPGQQVGEMNWNDFYNNLLLKVGQLISGYITGICVMQNGRSGGGLRLLLWGKNFGKRQKVKII